jgi:hypothetical protein
VNLISQLLILKDYPEKKGSWIKVLESLGIEANTTNGLENIYEVTTKKSTLS